MEGLIANVTFLVQALVIGILSLFAAYILGRTVTMGVMRSIQEARDLHVKQLKQRRQSSG